MNIYFGFDGDIKMAYVNCPYGCGFQEKADASDGNESGKSTVIKKMNMHIDRCDKNPEKEQSDIDELKKRLGLNG